MYSPARWMSDGSTHFPTWVLPVDGRFLVSISFVALRRTRRAASDLIATASSGCAGQRMGRLSAFKRWRCNVWAAAGVMRTNGKPWACTTAATLPDVGVDVAITSCAAFYREGSVGQHRCLLSAFGSRCGCERTAVKLSTILIAELPTCLRSCCVSACCTCVFGVQHLLARLLFPQHAQKQTCAPNTHPKYHAALFWRNV